MNASWFMVDDGHHTLVPHQWIPALQASGTLSCDPREGSGDRVHYSQSGSSQWGPVIANDHGLFELLLQGGNLAKYEGQRGKRSCQMWAGHGLSSSAVHCQVQDSFVSSCALQPSVMWQNFPGGDGHPGLPTPDTDPEKYQSTGTTKVQLGETMSFPGVIYRNRNDSKTVCLQGPHRHERQLTKTGKSGKYFTACRLLNRLECVLSKCLWSKPLPGSSAGFCFS